MSAAVLGAEARFFPDGAASWALLTACASRVAGGAAARDLERFAASAASESISAAAAQSSAVAQTRPRRVAIEPGRWPRWLRRPLQKWPVPGTTQSLSRFLILGSCPVAGMFWTHAGILECGGVRYVPTARE